MAEGSRNEFVANSKGKRKFRRLCQIFGHGVSLEHMIIEG